MLEFTPISTLNETGELGMAEHSGDKGNFVASPECAAEVGAAGFYAAVVDTFDVFIVTESLDKFS